MTPDSDKIWRCGVCGYIHRGPEPPPVCPVCGSPKEAFQPFIEPKVSPESPPPQKWRCLVCNHIHDGPSPPNGCPVCGAVADRFESVAETAAHEAGEGKKVKAVIVGACAAGVAAAESLRAASPSAEITLVSKEPGLPYYRLNLSRYLAGEIGPDALPIHPESWYRENNIRLLQGEEATALLLDQDAIVLAGGERLEYEQLLLAVGAHPFVPPFPGASKEGVTCLRTAPETDAILEAGLSGAKCVCIGGGILGLETAAGLARRGAEATLLEGHGWLLPRQLNRRAGEILAAHASSAGIRLRPEARTREIAGDARARAVLLEDGTSLPADLVVVTTGIRSNTHLARRAGLEVHNGVVVDNLLTTSHPCVFAAGDVAEHQGTVYGIWGPSQYQGSIAGMNLAGAAVEFGGVPRSNTLKVLGVDLFSIGSVMPEDASYVAVEQERDGNYYRFLFRDNRLAGAILLGDTSTTPQVSRAMETGADLSGLLSKHPNAQEVLDHFSA